MKPSTQNESEQYIGYAFVVGENTEQRLRRKYRNTNKGGKKTGKQVVVKELPAKQNGTTLDLSHYANGIYNYRVVDIKGRKINSGKISLTR